MKVIATHNLDVSSNGWEYTSYVTINAPAGIDPKFEWSSDSNKDWGLKENPDCDGDIIVLGDIRIVFDEAFIYNGYTTKKIEA